MVASTTVILLAAGLAVSAAAAGYQGYSSWEAGKTQAAQAKSDARTQEAQAQIEASARRKQIQNVISQQDAIRAARGMSQTTGTALSIFSDTVTEGETDIRRSLISSELAKDRYRMQGQMARQGGRDAAISSGLTFLGSAGKSGGAIAKEYE